MRMRASLAIAISLLISLPALAVLQYGWLGELSRAEMQQMRSALKERAAAAAAICDRELGNLYATLQATAFAPGEVDPRTRLARNYKAWKKTASHPGLVRDVFVCEQGAYQYDREHGVFLEVAQSASCDVPGAGTIVVPLPPFLDVRPFRARALVKLDLPYVRTEYIPAVLRQAFGGSETGYDAEVREPEARHDHGQWSRPADAEVEIFRLTRGSLAESPGIMPVAGDASGAFGIVRDSASGPRATKSAGMLLLRFRHRAGSVEAAVALIRNRNLFIAFAIEAILATSILLLATAMRRRGELAARQIAFVAGLSHDLGTPLAVIRTLAQNQARGLLKDREQVTRYGEAMLSHLLRLTETVDKALRFAGLRSGHVVSHKVPVHLPSLLQRAVQLSRATHPESSRDIEVIAGAGIPEIAGDSEALSRVFQNLIANAIKYSAENSLIRIRARACTEVKRQTVEVVVEDHGCGIAARHISRIFDPFYRTPSAAASNIGGTGLGLTLVKAIVEAHGGCVTCESRPGQGSTFRVRLPRKSEGNGSVPE
jgi:signal transduction histidine kinase